MSSAGIAAALPKSNAAAESAASDYVARGRDLGRQMDEGISSAMSDFKAREAHADELESNLDPNALTPPKLEAPPEQKQTDPIKAWGSAAMMAAVLGGLFTKSPLKTSLNAAAGVMNAYKQRDATAAQQAYDAWKVSNQNAIDAARWAVDAYKDALEHIKTDRDAGKADLLAVAAALKDDTVPYMLQHYGVEAIARLVGDQDRAVATMESHQAGIDKANTQAQLFLALHSAHDDYQKALASKDPQAIATAKAEVMQANQAVTDFNALYAPPRGSSTRSGAESPADKNRIQFLKDHYDKAVTAYNAAIDPADKAAAKKAMDAAEKEYRTAVEGGGATAADADAQVDKIHTAGAGKTAQNPAKPTTKAEYNALPKGAYYVDPGDGQVHRKS